MTIEQLKIELELNAGDTASILEKHASFFENSYFFVDDEDGQCYLFSRNGEQKDIHEVAELHEEHISRNIKKIAIPGSVTKIGDRAFSYCTSLENISIPDSVIKIGYGAFANCISLKSISIPDSVTRIRSYAFKDCTSLASIAIPESVKEIGLYVFIRCNSLKSVIFKGKTRDEVENMKDYPWGIKDASVIRCI